MDETASVGVSVAVWRDGSVLLCRRGKPPFEGMWSLPGGMKQPGESLKAAARRELLEETSVTADITDIMETLDLPGVVLVVFRGRWLSGKARAGDDVRAVGWYGEDDFPGADSCTPDLSRIVFAGRPAEEGGR